MSTTLLKKETLERKWYVIDAAGKPLGRTAVIAANILRGKHKVDFTPNVDCGDNVIIINTDKAILTGKKLDQKKYYRVTGWIGNMKETKARVMMEKRSDYAMELAIKGMLPKNSIGRNAMTRLHLYKGNEPPHAAQKPEAWTLYFGGNLECTRARRSIFTAPAAGSPPWPASVFMRTAPAPSSSMAATSMITSAWRP